MPEPWDAFKKFVEKSEYHVHVKPRFNYMIKFITAVEKEGLQEKVMEELESDIFKTKTKAYDYISDNLIRYKEARSRGVNSFLCGTLLKYYKLFIESQSS